MNIILFEKDELDRPLGLDDARAKHVIEVIGCKQGDSFDVGIVDGPRGKARVGAIGKRGMVLDFHFLSEIPHLYPVAMVIGLPRPPSARRILKDLTSQGVSQLHFVATDKGEKSYLNSRLWTGDEYQRLLREGAEQAFCTRIPEVILHESLTACLDELAEGGDRLALDNYESSISIGQYRAQYGRCVLAVGSERGWSAAERQVLRARDFTLVGMGERVLKTETACIAGLALVLAKLTAY
ncbi:MAG: 16S rRNA (uracil1498-N3)-methyltransferase [Candidatus Latescibacterota bacterium]|jgi:16S rRNA (uracil1498-N3)-methyltransferase